jgi:hypothetical protein
MSKIEDIEIIIRDLIRTNEELVSKYDSEMLCRDYKNTKDILKELYDRKNELMESLEESLNEFFGIRQNFITKRIKVASFALVPTIIGYEYKFNLPKNVDKASNQYFCYISMMDRLVREFDVLVLKGDDYYILDISACLNIEKTIGAIK